jgi:hypothetical protein
MPPDSSFQILSYGGSHHGFLIDNKTLNFLEDFFYVTIPSHIQFLRGRFKIIKCKWPGLRIFDENQNPVGMHTSIMCINILQNIKAVAPKL